MKSCFNFSFWIMAALAALGVPAIGAAADEATPEFECRWVDEPITIDGKTDEAAWGHAQVIDRFALPWLQADARPAKTATRARLLWDREFLYFFADMDDGDLYADVVEQDGPTWENDVFELFFKPAEDKPGYYEFQVNAAGTRLDMFLPRRGSGGFRRYKDDGQFHIASAVELRGTLNQWHDQDNGWSVEGRIPWYDLLRTGGRPEIDERWRFALCRYDYSVDFEGPELSTCAPLGSLAHADFHHYEDYARLRFVGPGETGGVRPFGIERRVPLTTSRVVGSPEPPPPYRVKRVFEKLQITNPIGVAHQPGTDNLLLIHQLVAWTGDGRIVRIRDDENVTEAEPFLDPEGIAYGLAFHPNYAENGYMYVGSNGLTDGKKQTRVIRYTVSRQPPFAVDPASTRLIIAWESDGHNGGDLAFGLDGMLYVTSGDGTSDSDTNLTGQDVTKLLAKVLRIDVDHPAEGQQYSVPADNPFVGVPDFRPETWAYGFRNPWRITVDRQTGHIWVGNNGQDLWEQAFLVERGANYGWSVMEGSYPFYLNRQAGPTPFSKPTVEHPHSEFRSLTGGIVYNGSKLPELQGAYIYGDYSTGKIWGIRHDGTKAIWHKELADTTLQVTGFGADSRGELLIVDHAGGFYRLEPTPADAANRHFPKRLSESGLFQSVEGHVVAPGLIPYSVNSPLWSDGAYKERYMAVPSKEGEDLRIDFSTSRGWVFPDETVLVKSFALEMEAGNPASRRWIETRFLTKQQGEWVGYSYTWNDEQTDATLVAAAGLDREFAVRVAGSAEHPDGVRTQTWHYPSRTECMVCHSRAANYVLGLTEPQMNKVHDYGGVSDNQLRTLEHLGLLRVSTWSAEAIAALREDLAAQGKSEAEMNELVERQTSTRLQRAAPASSTLLARPPEKYRRLADPYDPRASLEERARSYLHANCSHCHVEAGGGNAQMQLEFFTALAQANVLDVKPLHHTFGIDDARLIAPGSPERSVLLYRVKHRGPGQMPQLATSIADDQAVEMLSEWIRELGKE